MRCEVCGRRIIGPPFKANIEGAKMLVCSECAKLGSVVWEAKAEPRLKKVARRMTAPVLPPKRQPPISVADNLELVDDFGNRIRLARERMSLSHQELGKKISEKVSVLRKIESGKMTPDNLLTEKLEHALRLKLLAPVSEPKIPTQALASRPASPTLGDILKVKKEKKET
ncbi:MAG TPA: multiprotein bridging factor aMBF1 [Candidatus Bathyarchaeia archaeon]|nr:multiprotein bridging factor aMBF1 [Candidatus Bathyarchaeia archaeon]